MAEIEWRKDSQSFNRVSELYETYRPDYPEQLVGDILAIAAMPDDGRILEIGSGTGKATGQFARRGYAMLCIEPGEDLIRVARQKVQAYPKVDFVRSTFEDWQGDGKPFDLVISGQAFHWIPPDLRYTKTAQALKEGGHLAIFWNWTLPQEDELTQRLQAVYAQHTPELVSEKSESHEEGILRWSGEISASNLYDLAAVNRYPWEAVFSTQQYLGLLNTYSDHLRLTDRRRRKLFQALGEVLEEAGGAITRHYEAVAFVGRKQ